MSPQLTVGIFLCLRLALLSEVHRKLDDLWSHGRHLVAEAVLVDSVHVRGESVLAVRLPLSGINDLPIRPADLQGRNVDVTINERISSECQTRTKC